MITKLSIITVLFLTVFSAGAQTGPGGVGSSANNIFWFDANRGISSFGPKITSWADQSGNGRTASPAAAKARPKLVTNSVNGNSSVDFDGINDELRVADGNALDLTAWHFFMVAIVDEAKDYNAWITKGNEGQENFELLSSGTNNIHAPIYWTDATRTAPVTGNSQLNTAAFEIIEYSYVYTAGRDIYKNNTSIYTDNENKIPQTNAFDMYIGNEKTTSRFADGDLAEVIGYNGVLNSAQRIIVNNYLSAKYNRPLGANDVYTMDNAGNGNYDYDVAGIGRVDATNTHTDSKGSGIIRVSNPAGLSDNEFLLWGHNNAVKNANEIADVPPGVAARMQRVWRVSESGEVGNVTISIDLTGLGNVTASDLRLLIDTDNDNSFADEAAISGAIQVGSNTYQWTNIGLNNANRFSFGTINSGQTPLPVELVKFYAAPENEQVILSWVTATEKNNNRFEIEKSQDGTRYTKLGEESTKAPSGNSTVMLSYSYPDKSPYSGMSYYRLKQVDNNGSYKYGPVISVALEEKANVRFVVFPNPNNGEFSVDFSGVENEQDVTIEIYNILGKQVYKDKFTSESIVTNTVHIVLKEKIEAGQYLINFYLQDSKYPVRVLVD